MVMQIKLIVVVVVDRSIYNFNSRVLLFRDLLILFFLTQNQLAPFLLKQSVVRILQPVRSLQSSFYTLSVFYTQSASARPRFIPSPYFLPSPQSVVRSPCFVLTAVNNRFLNDYLFSPFSHRPKCTLLPPHPLPPTPHFFSNYSWVLQQPQEKSKAIVMQNLGGLTRGITVQDLCQTHPTTDQLNCVCVFFPNNLKKTLNNGDAKLSFFSIKVPLKSCL